MPPFIKTSLLLTLLLIYCHTIQAQEETSIIRGVVVDRNSDAPIAGAVIELLNVLPRISTSTTREGNFILKDVPAGRCRLRVTALGYQEKIVADLLIESGKRPNLRIALEEEIVKDLGNINDIPSSEPEKKGSKIIFNETSKDKPNNNMAGISARPFTVEEVTRYAGMRFDPARMLTNYAGAAGYDDSRNDIVVRGNSPGHILWQIEELPIENPNHISSIGTTGGTTPILNVFALGQSDFMTGAFAAQYGNALSGVFDLRLRQGDASGFSFMGQLGTQRAEVLLEGPLSKAQRGGSYLISLRSATGSYLLSGLIPTDPGHQDINLKISTGRQNWGELEFFAIAGHSHIFMPYTQNTFPEDSRGSLFINPTRQAFYNKVRYDIYEYEDYQHRNLMGLAGLKFTKTLSKNTFWRTVAGVSYHNAFARWVLNEEDSTGIVETSPTYKIDNRRNNYMLHSYINSKINSKISLRGGLLANVYDFNLKEVSLIADAIEQDFEGVFGLFQAYIQGRFQVLPNLILHTGLHSQYLTLNQQITVEPRFALNWQFLRGHTLSLGYGWHQQMVPFVSSFYQYQYDDGTYFREHYKLPFMGSQHLGFSYDWYINNDWRFRFEAYAQFLSRIPVHNDSSAHSQLNFGAAFYDLNSDILVSEGKGRNWGLEFTIEKFFSNNFYGQLSATYFDSKATGSDGIWYNTRFNYQYIANFLAGKEFFLGTMKRNVLFIDIRFSTMGGKPYTPIDLEATFQDADFNEIYIDEETNVRRLAPFYQLDAKVGLRINSKNMTHTFKLDMFNVLNLQNPLTVRYSERYNPLGAPERGTERIIHQRGFIPDITYTIQF